MTGHMDESILNDDSERPGRGSRTLAVRARSSSSQPVAVRCAASRPRWTLTRPDWVLEVIPNNFQKGCVVCIEDRMSVLNGFKFSYGHTWKHLHTTLTYIHMEYILKPDCFRIQVIREILQDLLWLRRTPGLRFYKILLCKVCTAMYVQQSMRSNVYTAVSMSNKIQPFNWFARTEK